MEGVHDAERRVPAWTTAEWTMGFPISDVLTDESIVSIFTCKICCNLVRQPRQVHALLARLLRELPLLGPRGAPTPRCWRGCDERRIRARDRGARRATPARGRGQGGAAADAAARVEAPRPRPGAVSAARQHVGGGDLSEVSAHFTNSESHLKGQDYAPSNATQNAEALKNQGNAKFQSHAYRAIQPTQPSPPRPGWRPTTVTEPPRGSWWAPRRSAPRTASEPSSWTADTSRGTCAQGRRAVGRRRSRGTAARRADAMPGGKEIEEELARAIPQRGLAEGERALHADEPVRRWRCSRRRRGSPSAAVTLGAARAEIALGHATARRERRGR